VVRVGTVGYADGVQRSPSYASSSDDWSGATGHSRGDLCDKAPGLDFRLLLCGRRFHGNDEMAVWAMAAPGGFSLGSFGPA